jgi:hypothetical protein
MKIINKQVKSDIGFKINIRYIIKEEDRKIIAIAKFRNLDGIENFKLDKSTFGFKRINNDDNANNIKIVLDKIDFISNSNGFTPMWNPTMEKKLRMHKQYTSVATCDPRDEWNEETGIEVVTEKIIKKIDTAIVNRLALAYDKMRSVKIPEIIIVK